MPSSTESNYLVNAELAFLLRGTAYSSPATIYVALFTTLPGLDGTGGTEVPTSGTGYGRQPITRNSGWNGPNSNGEWSNGQDIVFGAPIANWGTIVGAGLYDASTGGNLLFISPSATPKTISAGDGSPRILASMLSISRATCS